MKKLLALLTICGACGGTDPSSREKPRSEDLTAICRSFPGSVGCACSLDSDCSCGLLCHGQQAVTNSCGQTSGFAGGTCYDPCAGGICTE